MQVVIVAAGMDAALPSVIGGLVPGVVIAVPTSVGYGVAAGGHAALDAILASCAPGIVVVNIDNGYGAACAAMRVLGATGQQSGASTMERRDFMKASAGVAAAGIAAAARAAPASGGERASSARSRHDRRRTA